MIPVTRKPRVTVSEAIACLINRIFVTPSGEHYSLVSCEKVGRTKIFRYKWTDCPEYITDLLPNTLQSKKQLPLEEIIFWIKELRESYIKFGGESST